MDHQQVSEPLLYQLPGDGRCLCVLFVDGGLPRVFWGVAPELKEVPVQRATQNRVTGSHEVITDMCRVLCTGRFASVTYQEGPGPEYGEPLPTRAHTVIVRDGSATVLPVPAKSANSISVTRYNG